MISWVQNKSILYSPGLCEPTQQAEQNREEHKPWTKTIACLTCSRSHTAAHQWPGLFLAQPGWFSLLKFDSTGNQSANYCVIKIWLTCVVLLECAFTAARNIFDPSDLAWRISLKYSGDEKVCWRSVLTMIDIWTAEKIELPKKFELPKDYTAKAVDEVHISSDKSTHPGFDRRGKLFLALNLTELLVSGLFFPTCNLYRLCLLCCRCGFFGRFLFFGFF